MTQVTINLYQGMSHQCSYLADQVACMHVVDPDFNITPGHYGRLLESGFRRSGDMVYRPGCLACDACIPARIRVDDFRPNRSQRRTRGKISTSLSEAGTQNLMNSISISIAPISPAGTLTGKCRPKP